MKVGVFTFHKSHNYGAFLQAYALTKQLENMGFDAEIIDFNMEVAEKQYSVKHKHPIIRYHLKKRHKMFKDSFLNLPMSKESYVSNDIKAFVNFVKGKYDLIIAGSDEIWRIDSTRGFPNPYWLLGDLGADKISYAASSRTDFASISDVHKEYVCNALKDFKVIGVRDKFSFEQLKNCVSTPDKVKMCCDPTFLYNFEISYKKGKEILDVRRSIDKHKKTLVLMSNDKEMAKCIRKKYYRKVNLVSVYNYFSGYINIMDINPFEWIDVIAAADLLISNYFHGICFAMKCNTQFIAVDSREGITENGKIYDLLAKEQLLERFYSTKDIKYLEKLVQLSEELLKCEKPDFTANVNHQIGISSDILQEISKYLENNAKG